MSLTALIPAPYRWLALALFAAALMGFGAVKGVQFQERRDASKLTKLQNEWDAERAAQAKAVQSQKDRNLALQRAAETRYVVQQDARERFIVTTVKEIADASAPLAACAVPDAVRMRLNAVRSCALGDSASGCGPDGAVPGP